MFVINIVYSEGLMNGREVVPIMGSDMYEVIERAYLHYKDDYAEAVDLVYDCEELSLSEFSNVMIEGFKDDDAFVLIQEYYCHIQYEPTAWH